MSYLECSKCGCWRQDPEPRCMDRQCRCHPQNRTNEEILRARNAELEAERDAATKRAENAEYEWHKCETLAKETEYLWRKAEAERDAAKAEAARVSLANKKIRAIDENGNPTMRWSEIDEMARQAIAQPALAWLAQREREKAAEELERMCVENEERFGTHFMEMTTDSLRARAAALRAGKEVGDAE